MADVIKFNSLLIKDLETIDFESFCAVMNYLKLIKMIIDSDDRLNFEWK